MKKHCHLENWIPFAWPYIIFHLISKAFIYSGLKREPSLKEMVSRLYKDNLTSNISLLSRGCCTNNRLFMDDYNIPFEKSAVCIPYAFYYCVWIHCNIVTHSNSMYYSKGTRYVNLNSNPLGYTLCFSCILDVEATFDSLSSD